MNDVSAQTNYSHFGYSFTPKGDLRALIVCIRFGEAVDTTIKIDVSTWDSYKPYPECFYNKHTFYTDYADFDLPIDSARDVQNISRWYYEMSKLSGHPLKIIANAIRVDMKMLI